MHSHGLPEQDGQRLVGCPGRHVQGCHPVAIARNNQRSDPACVAGGVEHQPRTRVRAVLDTKVQRRPAVPVETAARARRVRVFKVQVSGASACLNIDTSTAASRTQL
eukprot:COSAG01_NODE_4154_length_5292_cov_6.751396_6_plen_107_part_00